MAWTEQEFETVRNVGLRLVCDLRSPYERGRLPHSWPGDADLEILVDDHGAEDVTGQSLREAIVALDDGTGEAARQFMIDGYRRFPAALAGILRAFVDGILIGRLPALLHCAASKDRTGFGCAMLLTALGASRDVTEEEYLQSNVITTRSGPERWSRQTRGRLLPGTRQRP